MCIILFILFLIYSSSSKKIRLLKKSISNNGYDQRFRIIKQNIEREDQLNELSKIKSNFEKLNLLKQLKDPELSELKKMELLEPYFKLNKIQGANLIGGKLFDEFLNN
jgi:predicted Holliday junction resolvase-like endonuclease